MDNEYKKGGAFELPEAGSFPARLVSIIEIGTVKTQFFEKGSFKEGQAPTLNAETGQFEDNKKQRVDAEGYRLDAEGNKKLKYAHQVSLSFEGQNDEKRFFVRTKDLTLSLNDRAILSKYLEALLGRKIVEGDKPRTLLEEALGKPCIVTVTHVQVGDKTYANLGNVAVPMKGMNVLEAKAPLTFLNFKNWDQEAFEKLPEFVRDKIRNSSEYRKMAGQVSAASEESKKEALNTEGTTDWVDEFGVKHTIPF